VPVRSLLVTLIYSFLAWKLRISEDINQLIEKYLPGKRGADI
jgi:hypothetical protein